MKTALIYVSILGFIFSCASTKMSTPSEMEALKTLLNSKSFEFTADWANPMATRSLNAIANAGLLPPGSTASRIDIAGNSNYLKVFGDSVSANLAYYGERQFGGGYGAAQGIEFNGTTTDYNQTFDTDRGTYMISFTINNSMELYAVTLNVYSDKTSTVVINSSNRLSIRYEGTLEAMEDNTK